MINLIFGMITILLSTVTFIGEDEGEMLYTIELETLDSKSIRYDYVTEKELQIYFETGKIRKDSIDLNLDVLHLAFN